MRVAIDGNSSDIEAISELLFPWNVKFTSPNDAELVIVARASNAPKTPKILGAKNAIVLPSAFEHAVRLEIGKNMTLLGQDIVRDYFGILNETLSVRSSVFYRILTGLPISYEKAPGQIRNLFMRSAATKLGNDKRPLFNYTLRLDCLRSILVSAIEKLSKKILQKKTWNGRKYACLLTHDIDSREGLRQACVLERMEEKYDLPSAWYVPSAHFRLDLPAIRELANNGEIGSHDMRHDGRLACLSEQKMMERLFSSRKVLSKYAGCAIEGFRAPLLQHNLGIMDALRSVGYSYDTSIPTWEPRHPSTMRPHGIGTVFPMIIRDVVEVPVTLPQDHQMMHVLNYDPKGTMEFWKHLMNTIKEMGGLCVFLVHPDYELAHPKNIGVYEDLLSTIKTDHDSWTALPRDIGKMRLADAQTSRLKCARVKERE
jgi:hypothetical protein